MGHLSEYDGKQFQDITRGELDLGSQKSAIGTKCKDNKDCENEGENLVCIDNTCVPIESDISIQSIQKNTRFRKTIDFFDWYINVKNKKLSGRYFVLDYDKIFEKSYVNEIGKNENNLKMRRREINESN